MRMKMQLIALGLFLSQASVAWAQTLDHEVVLRTAGSFLRDSLPKQPIVVDNEMFRARPAITASEADAVARAIGAGRGRFGDVIQCVRSTGAGATRKVCTASEQKTVLAFALPVVRTDSAEVDVYWVYMRNSHLVGRTARLVLGRQPNGKWQVQSMRGTGQS